MAAGNRRIVSFSPQISKPCKLIKWKVHSGSRMTLGTVLLIYEYVDSNTENLATKLKSTTEGTVQSLIAKEGDVIIPGCELLELQSCLHSVVMKDLCAECGADLRELGVDRLAQVVAQTTFSMIHSVPELRVSQEQARKLGEADEERLLKSRKLVLLVDLDQTLIHTTNENVPADMNGIFHFQLYGARSPWYHTKFRPGTHNFLQKISALFELHIFTFGARPYAHHIASLMDPKGCFFSHRILSRDECLSANSKSGNLKALFPCGDSMVCIIDDREDVWNYAPNVVQVKPYLYFSGTGDINSPCGLDPMDVPTSQFKNFASQEPSKTAQDEQKPSTDEQKTSEQQDLTEETPKKENSNNDTANENSTSEVNGETENGKPCTENEVNPEVKVSETSNSVCRNDDEAVGEPCKETLTDMECENKSVEENCAPEDGVSGNNEDENGGSDLIVDESGDDLEPVQVDDAVKNDETKQANGVPDSPNATETEKSAESESNQLESKTETEKPANSQETGTAQAPNQSEDDDYLMYLDDILTTIHKAFYDMYDQLQVQGEKIPDLKSVIPYVRRKVLKGVNIVFSGVIPTTCNPEKSKLWSLAKAFGANVTVDLMSPDSAYATTHVIAARLGTAKVNKAKKMKGIHIVNPEWLSSCTERWEKVDERLFPLTEESVMRKPTRQVEHRDKTLMDFPPNVTYTGHAMRAVEPPEEQCPVYDPVTGKRIRLTAAQKPVPFPVVHVKNIRRSKKGHSKIGPPDSFSNSLSPLLSFSSNEIEAMGREVDDACSEESENEGEKSSDSCEDTRAKKNEETSSEDSLSAGDRPKGWKKRNKVNKDAEQTDSDEENKVKKEESSSEGSVQERQPGWKKRHRSGNAVAEQDRCDGVLESEDESCVSKFPRCEIPVDSEGSEVSNSDSNQSIGSVDEEMAAAVEREFLGC